MNKILNILLVIVFMGVGCSFVFAQEQKDTMMTKEMIGKKDKMSSAKMMHMPLMDMMMSRDMVATEDGGVIIMVGNKLLKYDKDLNLKKEIEIKMDMQDMQKMMEEMMQKCPMYKMHKMGREGRMGSGTSEDSQELSEPNE